MFHEQKGGDDASETTVNMYKSPVAPKAGVQPCECAVIADPPNLGSQAPLFLVTFAPECSSKHGKERIETRWHGSSSSGVLRANLGKDAHETVPCESLSQSCRSHSKDGRGSLCKFIQTGFIRPCFIKLLASHKNLDVNKEENSPQMVSI